MLPGTSIFFLFLFLFPQYRCRPAALNGGPRKGCHWRLPGIGQCSGTSGQQVRHTETEPLPNRRAEETKLQEVRHLRFQMPQIAIANPAPYTAARRM